MAATAHPSRINKVARSSSPAHIVTASNSLAKGASRPSSPRLHNSNNNNHQPYPNQLRSPSTSINSSKQKYTSNSNKNNRSSSRPTSPSPSPLTGSSSQPSGTAINVKHGHSLTTSACAPYPHPSVHPPLRLLTTATCLDTLTCLVSAQSPPHSPTFSSFALPKSSSASTSSRANSILDGIQSALGGALSASSPPLSSSKSTFSSTYSAAKESLADFSIAASKRSHSYSSQNSESLGVVRSRSNYVSFPNFDEVDFVDVAMVDDDGEEDDQQDWSGPDSPPEGQHPHHHHHQMMDSDLGNDASNSLDEKTMRSSVVPGYNVDRRTVLGMPTSPSQHWLLQLETYHEQRVNN